MNVSKKYYSMFDSPQQPPKYVGLPIKLGSLVSKFDQIIPKRSVLSGQSKLAGCYVTRWFKCTLKQPKSYSPWAKIEACFKITIFAPALENYEF